MVSKINLETVVPIGMVFAIVGGAFWLGAMYRESQQTQMMLQESKREIQEFRKEYKEDYKYLNQKIDKILVSNNEKKVALIDEK
jgi:hypothetical protein